MFNDIQSQRMTSNTKHFYLYLGMIVYHQFSVVSRFRNALEHTCITYGFGGASFILHQIHNPFTIFFFIYSLYISFIIPSRWIEINTHKNVHILYILIYF